MKRLVCLAMVGFACACGGNKAAESAPPATPAEAAHDEHAGHHEHGKKGDGPVKPAGEAQVGDTTKCPVSGEEFVVEATSPKVEHEGKTYYFCCSGCQKKFQSDPAKYVNKS